MSIDILDAISIKLKSVFGDEYMVYADDAVVQDFMKPCFSIVPLLSSRKQLNTVRFSINNSYDVQYFPQKSGSIVEMLHIAERLYDVLEYANLNNGTTMQGTDLHYEPKNGVLHFYVQYNGFLLRKEEKHNMEDLSVNANVKG